MRSIVVPDTPTILSCRENVGSSAAFEPVDARRRAAEGLLTPPDDTLVSGVPLSGPVGRLSHRTRTSGRYPGSRVIRVVSDHWSSHAPTVLGVPFPPGPRWPAR